MRGAFGEVSITKTQGTAWTSWGYVVKVKGHVAAAMGYATAGEARRAATRAWIRIQRELGPHGAAIFYGAPVGEGE